MGEKTTEVRVCNIGHTHWRESKERGVYRETWDLGAVFLKEPNWAEAWAGRCRGPRMPDGQRALDWPSAQVVGLFLPDNRYLTNHYRGEFLLNTFKRFFGGFVFKTDPVSSGRSGGFPAGCRGNTWFN